MKKPVKGLARWEGKVLRGFFTISKADRLKKPVVRKAKRTREPNAPAPGLRSPGVRGPQPQRQGYAVETWQEAKRLTLREQLVDRVRGLVQGRGSLMNVDWERFKLSEALWNRAKRQEAAKSVEKARQRSARKPKPQNAAQPSKAKARTRVRPAPAFDKVQERSRMTPEKAYAQQQKARAAQRAPQAQRASQAPQKQAAQKLPEKGQLRRSTEHLFKPSAATERSAQIQREQAQDRDRERGG